MYDLATKPVAHIAQDTDAAWEVFHALSQHLSANPELDDNPYYKDQMHRAHRRWSDMFVGG